MGKPNKWTKETEQKYREALSIGVDITAASYYAGDYYIMEVKV